MGSNKKPEYCVKIFFFSYLILDRSDCSLSPPINGIRIVGLGIRRLEYFGVGVVPTLSVGSILLHELSIRLEEKRVS